MGLRNYALALLTVLISLLGQGVVKSALNQTRRAAIAEAGFVQNAMSAALNPLLWAGVGIMGAGAVCYFTLLYFTDFTKALPVMGAIGYLIIPVYGLIVLHESYTLTQAIGVVLLIVAIFLISK